jgi:DNA-binding MarR family transcriptional regulator
MRLRALAIQAEVITKLMARRGMAWHDQAEEMKDRAMPKAISIHEVRAFAFLKQRDSWTTNKELAEGARIAGRTAAAVTAKFSELGLVEIAQVFPERRYRLVKRKIGAAYLASIQQAAEAFGVAL